jgi:Zn-dependent peptidase ImmA (M78 family)
MANALWDRIDPDEAAIVRRYMAEIPVRVGALATELGLRVFRSSLPPNVSGMIMPVDEEPGVYEIRINKFESPERQRFTLAHEIAHFLLHKSDIRAGVIDNVMYRSQLTSKKEAEANRVAADIVMPASAVRRELGDRTRLIDDEIIDKLAAHFRVSIPAMKIRLGA